MAKSKKGSDDASVDKKPSAKKSTASRAKKVTSKTVTAQTAASAVIPPAEIEHKIRVRAYELFLERNSAYGDPQQDWFRAEAEVRAKLIA
jgi:hypothetical protein